MTGVSNILSSGNFIADSVGRKVLETGQNISSGIRQFFFSPATKTNRNPNQIVKHFQVLDKINFVENKGVQELLQSIKSSVDRSSSYKFNFPSAPQDNTTFGQFFKQPNVLNQVGAQPEEQPKEEYADRPNHLPGYPSSEEEDNNEEGDNKS